MKKVLPIALLAALGMSLLAGCASSGGEEPTNAPAATPEQASGANTTTESAPSADK